MKDFRILSPQRSLIAHMGGSFVGRQESCMIEVVVLAFKPSIFQSRTSFRACALPLETENDTRDTVSLCILPNGRGWSDPRRIYHSASSSAIELMIGYGLTDDGKPSL